MTAVIGSLLSGIPLQEHAIGPRGNRPMAIDARSRLRGSFADVLQRQAAELGQLARDALRDPDIRDALVFELDRIRGTALSLGVDAVDRATQQAKDVATGGGGNLIDAVE